MTEHLLIAGSLVNADSTATVDWGWRRAHGRHRWLTPDGTVVRYAHRDDQIRGRECVIYFGFGATESPVYELALERIAAGRAREGRP